MKRYRNPPASSRWAYRQFRPFHEHELSLLDDLLDVEEGLSDWGVGFLESMKDLRDQGRDVSNIQIEKLHELAAQVGLEDEE